LKTHTPDIYGKEVSMGEWIAVMGNSGVTSTGIHCHLTVKEVATGNIINPENIFEFI
jgi:murein DD-endopeptidase MepM/ murein hydrolase activator NlpD